MEHRAVSSPLANEVSKFVYKVKPVEFKRFKNANKEKYYFIFSKSTDRWLVTDKSRRLPGGLFATVGRYYVYEQEFRAEEKIEGFTECAGNKGLNTGTDGGTN